MTESSVLENNLNLNEPQNRQNNFRRNRPHRNPRNYNRFNAVNNYSFNNHQEEYNYLNNNSNSNYQSSYNNFHSHTEPNSFNQDNSYNRNFHQKKYSNYRPQSSWYKQKKSNNDNEKSASQKNEIKNENSELQKNKQKDKKQTDSKEIAVKAKNVNLSRSEILIDQLKKNKCECMVCYSIIRNDKQIWSCGCCYHIFHLSCIKKWALSPAAKVAENSPNWRCPGCQTIYHSIPNKYVCFCGKKINPEKENRPFYHLKLIPHSCQEVCGKSLSTSNQPEGLDCKHKCNEICHPGPCAPCEAVVNRTCNCGRAKFQVKCSSNKIPQCEEKCAELLNCSVHKCEKICHSGTCGPCDFDIEIKCYSHQLIKNVKCGSIEHKNSQNSMYNCDQICNKLLDCKKHRCEDKCHEGECQPCMLMPSKLINCPCGKTSTKFLLINQKIIRTQCTDPVPTCEKKCSKILQCNSSHTNEVHLCESKCHVGDCPPCEKIIEVKCRCDKQAFPVKCSQANEPVLCNRRCQKKKSCGKHQCNELCCSDKDHICMQICNRTLNCGLHKCEDLCHRGPCKRCLVASFEERICDCGKTIQYPPIRCGTKPLECPHQCTRDHSCDHPVTHNCHFESSCPPCSFLTSKMCMGNHEVRHNIPCHLKDVSCGKPCGKQLPNCLHTCIRTCHKGECVDEQHQVCTQLCNKKRPHCEHLCNSACHGDTSCPETVCQALIKAKCKCGLKSKQVKCLQKMYSESSVVFENIASQLKEMLTNRTIDVSTFNKEEAMKKKYEIECDEECFLAERNRAITEALKIEALNRPQPIYEDFLKNFAREDPDFVFSIEQKFAALVNECRLFKTKKVAYLPVLKANERRFVHELAIYYGIETVSEDPEPYRTVTLYGNKEKCFVPSILLSKSIDLRSKQTGMPKLAIKQLNKKTLNPVSSNMKSLLPQNEPIILSKAFSALEDEQDDPNETQQFVAKSIANDQPIDYFDFE